jgi:hypothetical protein
MRFKDFEIVIHGDFESGDDELDLRSAIAKKLGSLSQSAEQIQNQTIEKIEDGDAKWSPPLQQHLDTIKQAVATDTVFAENINNNAQLLENISICTKCNHLIIKQQPITESFHKSWANIQKNWAKLLEHYGIKTSSCKLH